MFKSQETRTRMLRLLSEDSRFQILVPILDMRYLTLLNKNFKVLKLRPRM